MMNTYNEVTSQRQGKNSKKKGKKTSSKRRLDFVGAYQHHPSFCGEAFLSSTDQNTLNDVSF